MNEDSARNEQAGGSGARGGRANINAEELLTNVLPAAAQRDQVKLRQYLNGKVLFQLSDSNKNYVFDWSSEKLRTASVATPESEQNVDCTISLSESTLIKISTGEINPQIAMLTNKINVKGKIAFAVYIFNLILQ